MVGEWRGEEPRRILCDTSQAPSPESARQAGQIRVRSRILMNIPGWVMMRGRAESGPREATDEV
jgi:hypothetical protein